MGTSLKLSDELVNEARHEAEAADRSLTSQIEHWARLGRSVENVLRHEDILDLKRGRKGVAPPTRRDLLATLRKIASESSRKNLSARLKEGRAVYQDAGAGRVERIESDGTRTIGRFIERVFLPEDLKRATRRR